MQQLHSNNVQTIKQQIAASREKLRNLWNTRGFTDADVLAAGAEFDELLNLYLRLKQDSPSVSDAQRVVAIYPSNRDSL
jgi:hypothetical protein